MSSSLETLNKKLINMFPIYIQTKLNNINKAPVGDICPAKRINNSARIIIPYDIVKKNNLSIDDLSKFDSGVIVALMNDTYFKIKDSLDPFDKYLIENIGGDKKVSSLITIKNNEGTSSSHEEMKILSKMKEEIEKNRWIPVQRKAGKILHGTTYVGNDKWKGEYWYDVKGGDNKGSESSHTEQPQLFNGYQRAMNEHTIIVVQANLLFQMLHFPGIEEYVPDYKKYIKDYELLLDEITYDECNLLKYNKQFIRDGVYICPLNVTPITMDDFKIKHNQHDRYIQICHNEAAAKKKIYIDNCTGEFLTDYRPTNLFWGTRVGNMGQQNMTISEYKMHCIELGKRHASSD